MKFKFKDILNFAGNVTSVVAPPVGMAINAINAMLPSDEKLPDDATVNDIKKKYEALPESDRTALYEKELELEITDSNNWREIQEALSKADAANSSTRPYIAVIMAWTVVIAINITVGAFAICLAFSNTDGIAAIQNAWSFILAVLGTPTVLLRSYFGMRTEEKKARYALAGGEPQVSGLQSLISLFRK